MDDVSFLFIFYDYTKLKIRHSAYSFVIIASASNPARDSCITVIASSRNTVTWSPVYIFFTVTLSSRISSSPRNIAYGIDNYLPYEVWPKYLPQKTYHRSLE